MISWRGRDTGPFLSAFPTPSSFLLLANPRMMDRCRVQRVTNGRLPRQVVPLKNPLERFNLWEEGGTYGDRVSEGRETAPNEGASLVGSADNCVVLFGSDGWLAEKKKRGKGKLNLELLFTSVETYCNGIVQYAWCLQKKKCFISFISTRSKSVDL